MSTKQTTYSADFKTKVVLELLEGDLTLNQISTKYSLVPKSVRNWKNIFLKNANLAFNIDKEALRHKEQLASKQKEVDELITTFDLTGDKLISPEEFFNIIMYAYS